MRSRILLLSLFSLAAQVVLCTPAPKLQRDSTNDCTSYVEEDAQNQFDLGPVDTCEIPPTKFCLNVDYPVPTSIANLTDIFEKEIEADYTDRMLQGSMACANAIREVSCAMRFPRCSEDRTTVTLGADLVENCTAKIAVCISEPQDEDRVNSYCNLSGTYPLGNNDSVDSCKPVTSFSNYSFEYCPLNSEWSVTQWMYELLVHTDVQLGAVFSGLSRYEACWPNFIKYMCQRVGRCWSSQTSRVESINSLTSCEDTLNCFPDWLAEYLRERHECSLWPREDSLITIEPCTPTTAPTTGATTASTSTPVATTKTPEPTWPTTTQPNFPTISNARVLLSSTFLLFVLVGLALVVVA